MFAGYDFDVIQRSWVYLFRDGMSFTLTLTGLPMLGGIFFGANVLAGFSSLAVVWLARRFGLINTMVFTQLPSNVLLMLVPLMPNLPLAITVLMIRFSISQMDVPTRILHHGCR